MKEKDLINGCRKGDTSSQRELVRRYATLFKGISMRYLHDEPAADDAVQESFVKVFQNIKGYRNEGSFEGWMKRIAVNTTLNYKRKYFKVHYRTEEIFDHSHQEVILPQAYANLNAEALTNLLKNLTEPYYIVFNLYVIEGFSHKEIADKLDITASSSRAILSRARKKLITLLENDTGFTPSFLKIADHEV